MGRSKSSSRWLKEHFSDQYVIRAQQEGYRSRAVYKLLELNEKQQLFKKGMTVIDLGAAPGGWSQYAAACVGEKGTVLASDILEIEPIPDVEFIHGDFREEAVFKQIMTALSGKPVDLVISDMAPNMSGMDAVDQPRAMYLVELAQDLARQVLRPKGSFICKLIQGQGSDQWLAELRQEYSKVAIKKPKASRPRSREVYVLATGFKPN